jgi:NADPH2:quinone reductase
VCRRGDGCRAAGRNALGKPLPPKPAVTDGKVLVRITAAGVTPLDHTILSDKFHGSKPPLVLGNIKQRAWWKWEAVPTFPPDHARCFFGSYGAFEDDIYSEWVVVRKENICLPENVDDASALGIPVAYLTAQVALTRAALRPGKTVLSPAIGGSIGNAATYWRAPRVQNMPCQARRIMRKPSR